MRIQMYLNTWNMLLFLTLEFILSIVHYNNSLTGKNAGKEWGEHKYEEYKYEYSSIFTQNNSVKNV